MAAALLAWAAVALLALQDRSIDRENSAERLAAASRGAERLLAEVEMQGKLIARVDAGRLEELEGGAYLRTVGEHAAADGRLFRIAVSITYRGPAGQPRGFELEKWVFQGSGSQGASPKPS